MRRVVRRQHVGVALFPFLAVLICTMGSLIVLLVLLVQQARLDARSIAAEQAVSAAANDEQLQQQLEEAQWKREMLEQSRAEKTKELSDSRAKLAHLEDHIQRLAARARELMERAQAIDQGKQLQDDQLAVARSELAKLQQEIANKQAELVEARKKLKDQEQWFALIPYEGPHGTRRQPIYIECTERGVVLQPEGIVFSTEDFNGPLGPHNPLDSALRTVREHRSALARGAGEPYPLLVVRPGGIVAYGAARAALKDWDEEFGYELVGDEKKLVFGSPDPALAAALEKSVAVARRRQAAMAAMMPRRYQDDEPLVSFSPDSIDSSTGRPLKSGGSGLGTGTGRGATGGQAGNLPGGSGAMGAAGGARPELGNPRSGGLAMSGAGGSALASGYLGAGGAPGAPGSGSGGSALASGSAGGPARSAGQPGNLGGNSNTAASSGANFAAGPYGPSSGGQAAGGQPTGGPSGSNRSGSTAAVSPGSTTNGNVAGGGSAAAGSQASTSGGQMSGSSSSSGDSQQGGSAGTSLQFGQRGQPQQGATSGSTSSAAAAAAQGRGRDWALPGASRHATAITRPIHVAVLLDRLVLIPERGTDRVPTHLRISDRMTVEEIDAFVAAVQREMKSWGLAVRNGYWKPVLQVEVAPDSEHHFADLQMSLANSGFEVQRKQP